MKEKEKIKKFQHLFLNPKILEEKLRMTMSKYGIKNVDLSVMQLMSDSIKTKYTNII